MISINRETQLCISIASRPSNFGTTLHNASYEALGLNFIYKAFGITDLKKAIDGVRALNIRGCSVSMPFKKMVIPYLDDVDETVRVIGAVNTIVNESGRLLGYNTDVIGAKIALESVNVSKEESVLLLGAGGVARAILYALKILGIKKVRIANRSEEKILPLNAILPCESVKWSDRHSKSGNILINATSIGMTPSSESIPLDENFIQKFRAVMDVVVSPMESKLIGSARLAGKEVAPGYLMSLEQAIAQFKLYTGFEPPRDIMKNNIIDLLKKIN